MLMQTSCPPRKPRLSRILIDGQIQAYPHTVLLCPNTATMQSSLNKEHHKSTRMFGATLGRKILMKQHILLKLFEGSHGWHLPSCWQWRLPRLCSYLWHWRRGLLSMVLATSHDMSPKKCHVSIWFIDMKKVKGKLKKGCFINLHLTSNLSWDNHEYTDF